jgi:phage major head subunit gpT-like protein
MLPVLEEIFRAELALHPSLRERIFKVVPTDRDIWQSTEIHDLKLFTQISEGQDYVFDRVHQGANLTLTVVKYGLGFSISEEAVDDGKFDLIGDMTRRLARSGYETQMVNSMAVINNGFTTQTTADGVSLFNTAHTLPSGSTFRNQLTTNSDLSVTSLDGMLSDFETQFVGDTGIFYRIRPRILLVHPNARRYALELVGSNLKADTSDNNVNPFLDDQLMVYSDPHLTDQDQFTLLALPEETGLRIVVRKPIETKAAGPDVGFNSDSIYYKSRYREVIGTTHPYGVFSTPGAP